MNSMPSTRSGTKDAIASACAALPPVVATTTFSSLSATDSSSTSPDSSSDQGTREVKIKTGEHSSRGTEQHLSSRNKRLRCLLRA